jgi:phosphatidylglycerophosphate synthase
MIESPAGPRELGLMHKLYKPTIFSALARALPPRLHPNVITLTGQACAVAAATAAYFAARGATALYLLSALLHFAYLTSDNVDGMHARRTRQVSSTGELLDHGLDGIAILCLALTLGFVLHVQGPFLVTFATLPALAFLLAHWEHAQTDHFGPVTCQADGYTLGAVICVLASVFDEPPWLSFSPTRLNAALLLVTLLFPVSLLAVLGPALRAWRRRAAFSAVLLASGIMACMHLYAFQGAPAWIVAASVGLFGTNVGVRAIRGRLLRRAGRLLAAHDALLLFPGLVKLVFLPALSSDAVAGIAAAVAGLSLSVSFCGALFELRSLDVRDLRARTR